MFSQTMCGSGTTSKRKQLIAPFGMLAKMSAEQNKKHASREARVRRI